MKIVPREILNQYQGFMQEEEIELWKKIANIAGVNIYSDLSTIENNNGQITKETIAKNTPGQRSDFSDGRINTANADNLAINKKVRTQIIKGIDKKFGADMTKAMQNVLNNPDSYLDAKVVKAINSLDNVQDLNEAADKVIDRLYAITGRKKPEDVIPLDGPEHQAMNAAIESKFGENAKEYKSLWGQALASKYYIEGVEQYAVKVFSDPNQKIDIKLADLQEPVRILKEALNQDLAQKKSLSMMKAVSQIPKSVLSVLKRSVTRSSSSRATTPHKTPSKGKGPGPSL
jgi:hypothetical protein